MSGVARIERALEAAIALTEQPGAPPGLAAAMRYSVFPGGARIRSRLGVAVALACGDDDPALSDATAAAIELLHCASLVHDDLPCFDDAATRRGRPSVHRAFGERLAVLAGDALIVLAFQTLAGGAVANPGRLAGLLTSVGASVGMPLGICAGQAWECEASVDLSDYQQAKTGALFSAATMAGAMSAGGAPEPWRRLGERLGEAYQVADDIRDVVSDAAALGKPTGQDAALGRPSAVLQLGIPGAVARLDRLAAEAIAAIPHCPGAADLRAIIKLEVQRLLPAGLAERTLVAA